MGTPKWNAKAIAQDTKGVSIGLSSTVSSEEATFG
jgi:hypothetical protein